MSDMVSRQAVLDIISRTVGKKNDIVYVKDIGRAFVEIGRMPGAKCEHCPLRREAS